ncbi:MAG: TonB-dependent receptor plug domain-containing protein [Cyclobacteriaceae bacterium]
MVTAKADRGSEAILLMERRDASEFIQNIGANELKKVGASDAGDGLKKVAGLSVQGSKFVVVRGLGDRYNGSYLNGFPVASPNPDKRVLPYDIFPTDVIQNLDVIKSFNTAYYGDFSGAMINLQTREYSDDPSLEVSVGVGYNTQSTFKNFLEDPEKGNDLFGYNKSREIPDFIGNYKSPLTGLEAPYKSGSLAGEITEDTYFQTSWDPVSRTAPLNSSYGISYTNYIKNDKQGGIGIFLNANYGDSYEIRPGRSVRLSTQGELLDFVTENSVYNTNTSAIANFTFDLNPNNKIQFSNLYTHLSENFTRETNGFFFDAQTGNEIYTRRIAYMDYQLLANQLQGEHQIGDRINVFWGASYSMAKHSEPDRRQVVFEYDPSEKDNLMYDLRTQDAAEQQRIFIKFDDTDISGKLGATYTLKQGSEEMDSPLMSISGGLQYRNKQREQDISRFNHNIFNNVDYNNRYPDGVFIYDVDELFGIENANSELFEVQETRVQGDGYNAEMNVLAPHVNYQWQVIPGKFEMNAGLRYEWARQEVNFTLRGEQQTILESDNILPSLGLKYNFSEESILRFSGSQTISRPDFKELAPFQYIALFGGFSTRGNPELQNGTNYNFDIRYERFFGNGGLIAIGGFAKYLDDPIVPVVLATNGLIQTYANGMGAELAGFEVELRRSLDFITPGLADFFFSANATVMYSNIEVGNQQIDGVDLIQTIDNRPLVGASPFLVNADISYNRMGDRLDFNAALNFNIFGRRIASLGSNGLGDIYDLPVESLNFTSGVDFGARRQWGISFSVRNILNPEIIQQQERIDQNTMEVTESVEVNRYQTGTNFNLGLSFKIL